MIKDISSGSSLSGRTKGARGIPNVRRGIGGQPQTGGKKPGKTGWPGVADSSLDPGDHQQSAK